MRISRTALAALALTLFVPGLARAHGQEALFLGLLLPASVVPVVFLVSLWFWRADVATKVLTGVLLVAVGAIIARINLLLLEAFADRLLYAPPIFDLLWWAPPIIVQGAAWALFARWRRRREGSTRS